MSRSTSRKRRIRLAVLRREVSDSQEWRIRILGDNGFAYRMISDRVFGEDSVASVRLVGRVLRRNNIRVTDYRKGESDTAKGVLHELSKNQTIKRYKGDAA